MLVPSMLNMADVMAESRYTEEQVFDLGISDDLVFLVVVPLVGACRVPIEALSHFMAGADDYTADGMPEHYSKALSGRWTIKRERLRILPASRHKWTAFVEDIEALSETQAETVEAAPPVEEAPAIPGESADGWNCLAINRGWEIISEAGGRWFPTQKDLAKQIEREFSEAKPRVMNMHGLPLETSTIERELKRHGVSCKTARAKASLNIRGN